MPFPIKRRIFRIYLRLHILTAFQNSQLEKFYSVHYSRWMPIIFREIIAVFSPFSSQFWYVKLIFCIYKCFRNKSSTNLYNIFEKFYFGFGLYIINFWFNISSPKKIERGQADWSSRVFQWTVSINPSHWTCSNQQYCLFNKSKRFLPVIALWSHFSR